MQVSRKTTVNDTILDTLQVHPCMLEPPVGQKPPLHGNYKPQVFACSSTFTHDLDGLK